MIPPELGRSHPSSPTSPPLVYPVPKLQPIREIPDPSHIERNCTDHGPELSAVPVDKTSRPETNAAYQKKSDCMLLPKWLGYSLLLSRSLFTQKTIVFLFIILSLSDMRQMMIRLGDLVLGMAHTTCAVWETHINSFANLHVTFVRNMTSFQVNAINSATTNAYEKSLEGVELTYNLLIYAIQKYFYAEKCLAIGVISTILDYSKYTSNFFDNFESLTNSVSHQWNQFVGVVPDEMSRLKLPSNFSIPSIPGHLTGDEFTRWLLDQETSIKNRLDPIYLLRGKLPAMPLEVLREDMFNLPNYVSVAFCDKIEWGILENGIRTLVFFATIALLIMILLFGIYLLGTIGYTYWDIRREIRQENVYSIRLLVDCGIFNGHILWKNFILHRPSLNAFVIGLVGLSMFVTLDRVVLLKKDNIRESTVHALNQSVLDSLQPLNHLSQVMTLKIVGSYNTGMGLAQQRITTWQQSLLEWSESIGQGQQQIESSVREKIVSGGGEDRMLLAKNIASTFNCLTTLFTNSLDMLGRIARLSIDFPQLPVDLRLINTEHVAEHMSSMIDHLLQDVIRIYIQHIRKQVMFYATLIGVGAFVPLVGVIVYVCLVWQAWFRRL
jgi:hypothetical protein